jgi:hypothetical protein
MLGSGRRSPGFDRRLCSSYEFAQLPLSRYPEKCRPRPHSKTSSTVKAGFAIEFPFLADGARIHWARETNPAGNSVGIHFVGTATGILVQRGMWPGRSGLHPDGEPDRWDSDVPATVRSREGLSSCPRIDEEQRLNRPVGDGFAGVTNSGFRNSGGFADSKNNVHLLF